MQQDIRSMNFDEQMAFLKHSAENVPPFPDFSDFKQMCSNIKDKADEIMCREPDWEPEWQRGDRPELTNYADKHGV